MNMMFNNEPEACVWLYVHGYRQNDNGDWLKGRKLAELCRSPANDVVVCVVFRRAQ